MRFSYALWKIPEHYKNASLNCSSLMQPIDTTRVQALLFDIMKAF